MSVEGTGPALELLVEKGLIKEDMSAEEVAEIVRNYEQEHGAKDHELVFSQGSASTPSDATASQQQATQQTTTQDPPAQAVQNQEPPAAAQQQQAEVVAPVQAPNGTTTIPYGVLKGTRERLAKATEDLERLRLERDELQQRLAAQGTPATQAQQQQVQQIADRAGIRDQQGNAIDVATVDISGLREAYPKELIDLIEGLQQKVITLESRDQSRVQRERLTEKEQQQLDIDSVPAWSEWQNAESDVMWTAANAALSKMRQDPAWASRPRVELMEEVARQFGRPTNPAAQQAAQTQATTATPGTKTVAAIQRAQERAVPLSHSDLPAGTAAAQSELEQLANLDATDIQVRMQNMTPEQQDEFIRKFG